MKNPKTNKNTLKEQKTKKKVKVIENQKNSHEMKMRKLKSNRKWKSPLI
jgi:hypothetical protein